MLITKRNEYALQVMILLARENTEENPVPISLLAGKMKISPLFLTKIAQDLKRAGLLQSWRGKYGGLSLSFPPEKIRIRDIFRAVDGPLAVSRCAVEGRCRPFSCPVYPVLKDLQADLDRKLNSARLSDFLEVKKR